MAAINNAESGANSFNDASKGPSLTECADIAEQLLHIKLSSILYDYDGCEKLFAESFEDALFKEHNFLFEPADNQAQRASDIMSAVSRLPAFQAAAELWMSELEFLSEHKHLQRRLSNKAAECIRNFGAHLTSRCNKILLPQAASSRQLSLQHLLEARLES